MKDVEFLQDHGPIKKGTVLSYHTSTANALAKHEVVKILRDTPIKTTVVNKVKQKNYDIKK